MTHTHSMKQSLSEYRMVQNEVVFRTANQRVQEGFDELKAISEEDGVDPIQVDYTTPLRFVCECSDENCTKRISVSLGEYNAIHKSSKYFMLSHEHDVPQIEDVVERKPGYIVVKKKVEPPKGAVTLAETDVENADK